MWTAFPALLRVFFALLKNDILHRKIADTRNKDTRRIEVIIEISQWLAVQKSVVEKLDVLAGRKPPQLV